MLGPLVTSAVLLLTASTPANAPGGDARATDELLEELAPLEQLDLVGLMNTGNLVVTASKVAREVRDAPASIETISGEQIRARGHRSIAEVLQNLVGFYVLDDQIIPNVSVRGVAGGLMSESGLIKVMIDGHPVAFRTTAGNWLGTELVPLEAVERLEIVRGPASALYGADAFLGVVNIITKKGAELSGVSGRLGATTNAGAGAVQGLGHRLDVVGGQRLGRLDVVVGVASEGLDHSGLALPESSPAARIPGYNAGRSSAQRLTQSSLTGLVKASYALVPERLVLRGTVTAAQIGRTGDFAQWTQLTSTSQGDGTRISLRQLRANLDLDWTITDALTVKVTGMYAAGGSTDADRIEVGSDFFYVERPFSFRAIDVGAEAIWQAAPDVTVVGGVELLHDDEQLPVERKIDKVSGDAFGGDSATERAITLANRGVYLQAEWLVLPQELGFTGGLRYDHHTIYGGRLSGRAGIIRHWTKKLTTKLLYGSAFKAPSPMLLFAEPLRPGDVVGNPALRPQMVHTTELQTIWTVHRKVELKSSVAYSVLLDKAEFRPQGINVAAQNVSSQRVLSWESEIAARHRDLVRAHLSFDLQYGLRSLGQEGYQAQLIGSENVVHPLWIVRGGTTLRVPGVPLEGTVTAMVVGRRRASDTNIYENGADYHLPAYARLDVALRTDEIDPFGIGATRLGLCGYNLLNSSVADPGFAGIDYPRVPVEVVLELSHRF